MRYAISATMNYRNREEDIGISGEWLDIDGIRSWVSNLLEREPEATSFMVVIIPVKEHHENVI